MMQHMDRANTDGFLSLSERNRNAETSHPCEWWNIHTLNRYMSKNIKNKVVIQSEIILVTVQKDTITLELLLETYLFTGCICSCCGSSYCICHNLPLYLRSICCLFAMKFSPMLR